MEGKIIQLRDRITKQLEYPVTLAESVIVPANPDEGTPERRLSEILQDGTIDIDEELDSTSTNPVQNKVVTEALSNAGRVKDVQVDGESVVDADGIANIELLPLIERIQRLEDIIEAITEERP